MSRINILDASWLAVESEETSMHVGNLQIFSLPPKASKTFLRDEVQRLKTAFEVVKPWNQKLAYPSFLGKLIAPTWVIDNNIDLDYHVRHSALPKPGGERELGILVSRLHSNRVDFKRPLWECHIIEGLENNRYAIYTKMHHSLIDGAGSDSFMSALHDLEPNPKKGEVVEEAKKVFADAQLGSTQLLGKSLVNRAKSTVPFTRGLLSTARDVTRMFRQVRNEELPALPTEAPKTRFNNPVGPHRVFDAVTFSLDEFKAIKNATGTTINDVAVAVVSGALRSYLLEHDDLPEESLAISIPVNMRSRRDASAENNQVGSTMGYIHTQIADPLERIKAIHLSLNDAKEFIETPFVDIMKLPGVFSPYIAKPLARMYVNRQLTKRMPMGDCGVLTNVPGPNFDLYSAGAKLVNFYCLGLLTPGSGLFHSVFSMSDSITISVTADREAMPDPDFYRTCLEESFDDLKAAAVPEKQARKAVVKKKPAAKKAVAKRPSAKKARTAKNPAAKKKKVAAKKKTSAKQPVAKKAAAKKSTRKQTPKNPAAIKTAAKKAVGVSEQEKDAAGKPSSNGAPKVAQLDSKANRVTANEAVLEDFRGGK